MCGIAGIVTSNQNLVTAQRIKKATDILAHRGPEGEGFFINPAGTVALGHRRLSIIDLSKRAGQPFAYLNRYYIVYNGELYNYIELKKSLQQQGYSFTTEGDTEVVIAAYAKYGADCVQHFDGMFAFAIWDEHEQTLFAARDRFGEKPFFYFYNEHEFVFASEMKALWAIGAPKEVNTALLYNFLTIGYTSNPQNPEETFYKNIYKLPPASCLHYSLPQHRLQVEKYWQVYIEEKNTITENEAVEQFRFLLADSVNKRLRSDVAIGTSLSGGLDSSSIVAYCTGQKSNHYTHKCFTAVFPGFEKNEEVYAREVAATFNLQHYIIPVKEDELISNINNVFHYQEEPFTSASIVAQYKVYEAAKRNGVTVVLDGQGADETIAGYTKYYKWRWQELYQKRKLTASGELAAAKATGVQESFSVYNKMAALFPHFSAALWQSKKEKQSYNNIHLNRDFAFANKQSLYYTLPTHFSLNGALHFNSFVYGLEELLRYADRNSSSHAVEVRLPFLSHQLVEFLFTLPPHFKIKNGWTKWLLRKSAEPLLPSSIVWRKEKIGFEPPQKLWMQHKQVQEAIREGKKCLVQQQILKPAVLNKEIQPQEAHAADNFDWRFWMASLMYTQH